MIVTIHQPMYLPWLGYLDKVRAADLFILLDTVQFEKGSFINRNRIKTASGPLMLTVPVIQEGLLAKPLYDVEVVETQPWRRKHLSSIKQSYGRAPNFADLFPKLEALYRVCSNERTSSFSRLGEEHHRFWCRHFGIDREIVRASEMAVVSGRSVFERFCSTHLLVELVRYVGGTTYLSGPLGRDYLDEREFKRAGIALEYHHFTHPTYEQLHGEFVPAMAALDAAFCGWTATEPHGTSEARETPVQLDGGGL